MQAERFPSVSPRQTSHQTAGTQDRSVSERASRSERRSRQRAPGHQGAAQEQRGSHAQAVGDGIASQLQGIIRDELRRIMEVQHRSVLAMMGALDQVGGPPFPPASALGPAPQVAVAPPLLQSSKPTSTSQKGRSPQPQRSRSQGHGVGPDDTENLEDESVAEMVSLKEEIVAQTSLRTQARPREVHRGGQVRGALTELHNLQTQAAQPIERQPSYADEISSRASRLFSHQPGPPSGQGSARFPLLAWGEPHQRPALMTGPLPLLHLETTSDPSMADPFRNLRRFLPQVPPPQPAYPGTPRSFSSQAAQPPPPSFPSFGQFPPPSQSYPPPPYDPLNIPLLSVQPPAETPLAPASHSPGFFPLLRILPPGSATSEQDMQRSKLEEARQRLLRKFQEQVLQDKENQQQAEMTAHRMLHLEPRTELRPETQPLEAPESARSEKSKVSDKVPSEREEAQQEDAVSERVASEQGGSTGGLDATLTEGGHTGSAAEASINDGYALPRGIFESYLQLGEHLMGPEAGQTSAAFQLKMAQAMQKQVEKRIRAKVDFSTMTQEQVDTAMGTDPAMEVVRTAEAATSITKDTGVDPIEEAVRDYNLKRHNNVVPPDIFMGLRFADQDGQAGVAPGAPSDEPGKGRAFLNVVDIRASAILRDIPERSADKEEGLGQEEITHPDLGSAMVASQRAALQMGALEETFREKLAPQSGPTAVPRGQDSLTVRMFDQLQAGRENRMSVAVMPRSSMSEPKSAMLRRLQDMSDQIRAIDDMSQNIEREFKSSHLLLNTIQDVNASIQRSRSPSPDRPKVSQVRHKELRYSLEDKTEEFDERDEEYEQAGSARTLTPHLPTPKTSTKSPQASARSKSSLASRSGSELTELLTEVLAEQGVDMESAGYSRELAQQLEMDAREQMARQAVFAKSKLTPREKLESLKKTEEEDSDRRTREQREDLKRWMADKFSQRQEEYRRHRQELIEREPKPFKSSGAPTTKQNLHKLTEERSERRQHMAADFMKQRLSEAEHLMGSIIVDKPEMPPWGALATGEGAPASQSASRSTFAGRGRKSRSPSRKAGPSSYRPAFSSRSPSETKMSREVPPPPTTTTTTVKGILKPSATSTTLAGEPARFSSSDLHLDPQYSGDLHLGNLASLSAEGLSVDSSADIINYARQILKMEGAGSLPGDSYELSTTPPPPRRRPTSQSPAKGAKKGATPQPKGKSFADMVRLQRPAATRKWQEVTRQRQLSAAAAAATQQNSARQGQALGGAGQKTWTVHDPNLVNGKPKEYGSKKIPGSSPRQAEGMSARRVKTYAERLQEMKPSSRTYSPPASRGRPGSARTMSSTRTRSTAQRGPAHKPQSYVEQLQSIGSRAGTSQRAAAGQGKIPVKMRKFLRSHGPAHQPKTYTEQLRALNPHPHSDTASTSTRRRAMPVSGPASSVGGGSRATSRHRPYGDPYSEMDYEELASVLSDWDMDENVRNIIYGGSTAASSMALRDDGDLSMSGGDMRRGAPSEVQSDYFDVIMQGDGPYRSADEENFPPAMGDYRSSVDIHEIERIADAASVGSGSVLSVIDWDAVNDLIKDV